MLDAERRCLHELGYDTAASPATRRASRFYESILWKLENVAVALMQQVGWLWQANRITVAREHIVPHIRAERENVPSIKFQYIRRHVCAQLVKFSLHTRYDGLTAFVVEGRKSEYTWARTYCVVAGVISAADLEAGLRTLAARIYSEEFTNHRRANFYANYRASRRAAATGAHN